MIDVRDSVWIDAPRETVFDGLDDPARQTTFTPRLTESTLVERLPNGGARVRYTYSLFGFELTGEVRATDYRAPERIVWAMTGDLHGTLRWYLDPERGGTRFTYAATYAVPGPAALRPLVTPLIRKANAHDLRQLLDAFKTQVEAAPSIVG